MRTLGLTSAVDRTGIEPAWQPSKGIPRTNAPARGHVRLAAPDSPYTQFVSAARKPSSELSTPDRKRSSTPAQRDERVTIPLNPMDALKALLETGPHEDTEGTGPQQQ